MGVRSGLLLPEAEELHEEGNESLRLQEDRYWMQKGGFWQIIKLYVLFPVFTVRLKDPQEGY